MSSSDWINIIGWFAAAFISTLFSIIVQKTIPPNDTISWFVRSHHKFDPFDIQTLRKYRKGFNSNFSRRQLNQIEWAAKCFESLWFNLPIFQLDQLLKLVSKDRIAELKKIIDNPNLDSIHFISFVFQNRGGKLIENINIKFKSLSTDKIYDCRIPCGIGDYKRALHMTQSQNEVNLKVDYINQKEFFEIEFVIVGFERNYLKTFWSPVVSIDMAERGISLKKVNFDFRPSNQAMIFRSILGIAILTLFVFGLILLNDIAANFLVFIGKFSMTTIGVIVIIWFCTVVYIVKRNIDVVIIRHGNNRRF